MPGTPGPNVGLVYGFVVGESGWGLTGFNPNFAELDTLLFLTVINMNLTAPPGSPVAGARYVPKATATGDWATHENDIAVWDDVESEWVFYTPKQGWTLRDNNTVADYRFSGTAWDKIVIDIADLGDVDTISVPPTDGQVLTWVDADSKFEPKDVPTGVTSLAGLIDDVDVTTTPPTDGQVLTWVDVDSKWEPSTISGGGGPIALDDLTDVIITSPADQDLIFYQTSSSKFINVTIADLSHVLTAFTGDSGSGGTKGAVPAPASGDAAAGKFLSADGTWDIPAGGGGGAGLDFEGDWSGFSAYVVGQVVQDDDDIVYVVYQDVDAPPGSLQIEGVAVGATGFNNQSTKSVSITTTGNNELVLIFVSLANGTSSSALNVDTVTSANLTFAKRNNFAHTAAFYSTDVECWYAIAATPLTSESITVTLNANAAGGGIAVVGIIGADPGAPFDINVSSEVNDFGTSSAAGSATFSSTGSDDIIFFVEVTTDTPTYGTPTGFTNIGASGSSGGVGNFSYKEYASPQSSVAVTSANTTNNHNVAIFSVTFASTGNIEPREDRSHFFGNLDLADLIDVDVGGGPSDGQALLWNTSDGTWQPGDILLSGDPVPTTANTGLSTWYNQGSSTVSDTAAGILITAANGGGNPSLRGRTKTAPTAPYTIEAKFTGPLGPFGSFPHVGFGWTDGTKAHVIDLLYDTSNHYWKAEVTEWTNATTFSAASSGAEGYVVGGNSIWAKLEDDATNVKISLSYDGVNYHQLYSVAKASGFLGGSGYTNILFEVNHTGSSGAVIGTLEAYHEN